MFCPCPVGSAIQMSLAVALDLFANIIIAISKWPALGLAFFTLVGHFVCRGCFGAFRDFWSVRPIMGSPRLCSLLLILLCQLHFWPSLEQLLGIFEAYRGSGWPMVMIRGVCSAPRFSPASSDSDGLQTSLRASPPSSSLDTNRRGGQGRIGIQAGRLSGEILRAIQKDSESPIGLKKDKRWPRYSQGGLSQLKSIPYT